MPIAQNQTTLDYHSAGYPFVLVPASTTLDLDGLDYTDGGAPIFASLGEISTSVLRSTQVVTEYLRDATDAGGGNLRSTEVATEWLILGSETVYVTEFVKERLSRSVPIAILGKSWMVFDDDNHLDIYASYGPAPTSAADDYAVLNGTNLALWGDEILGYRDVTSLGGSLYRLTHLLRGRYGTEWAMNTHRTGDRFILLTTTTVGRITQTTTDIGALRYYRAVTSGQLVSQATTRGFTHYGAGLKPYAPCFVQGSRDGSDNLTITWYRRSRINAEWRDAIDVPIGETTESYEVDILDGAGAVVRTLTDLATPTAAYSAADQTTDFGAPQALVVVVVYQLSGVVGRGYGTTVAV